MDKHNCIHCQKDIYIKDLDQDVYRMSGDIICKKCTGNVPVLNLSPIDIKLIRELASTCDSIETFINVLDTESHNLDINFSKFYEV